MGIADRGRVAGLAGSEIRAQERLQVGRIDAGGTAPGDGGVCHTGRILPCDRGDQRIARIGSSVNIMASASSASISAPGKPARAAATRSRVTTGIAACFRRPSVMPLLKTTGRDAGL